MEDKSMKRVELKDVEMEQVAGGNFNWWKEEDGTRMCWVNGVGTYVCTVDAKDTFAWLKADHKDDGWTEEMYVEELVRLGEFTPY